MEICSLPVHTEPKASALDEREKGVCGREDGIVRLMGGEGNGLTATLLCAQSCASEAVTRRPSDETVLF